MPIALLLRMAPYSIVLILAGICGTYLHHKGYAEGKAEVQLILDQRIQKDQTELEQANARERQKEQDHALAVADIETKHQEAIKNAQAEYEKIISSLRAGTIRVRDNRAAVCASVPAGQTTASTGVDNGAETSQLSESGAEFLLSIGNEADKVVEQLSACQAILVEDRR